LDNNEIHTRWGILLLNMSIFVPGRVNTIRMNTRDQSIALPLSRFVKEKRKGLGLTQKELGDKAGVGLRFVRELERDKPTLQKDKVNQVLVLFGFELGPVPINRNKLIHEKG